MLGDDLQQYVNNPNLMFRREWLERSAQLKNGALAASNYMQSEVLVFIAAVGCIAAAIFCPVLVIGIVPALIFLNKKAKVASDIFNSKRV